ncbi:MAG: hypothetical protein Q9218_003809 [Villophora microphyllina]
MSARSLNHPLSVSPPTTPPTKDLSIEPVNPTTNPPAPTGSPFLRLPPEIRNMIYHELFDNTSTEIHWSYPPSQSSTRRSKKVFFTNSEVNDRMPIILVNKLIREEALTIFHKQTHFKFDFGANPIFGINAFVRFIGTDNANLIRKISFELNMRTEHSVYREAGRYRGWRDTSLIQRLGRWVRHFPQLRELRLCYPHDFKDDEFDLGGHIPPNILKQAGFLEKIPLVLVESHWKPRVRGGELHDRKWVYKVILMDGTLRLLPYSADGRLFHFTNWRFVS